MKQIVRQFWTLFYYGEAETICSKHKSLSAAKYAARKCEKRGGERHRIVEVREVVPYKPNPAVRDGAPCAISP